MTRTVSLWGIATKLKWKNENEYIYQGYSGKAKRKGMLQEEKSEESAARGGFMKKFLYQDNRKCKISWFNVYSKMSCKNVFGNNTMKVSRVKWKILTDSKNKNKNKKDFC